MRSEIGRGAAWLSELSWCVRLPANPTCPVITADTPVVVDGKAPTLQEAPQDGETLVFIPVCWQACLIGSRARFDRETDAFNPSDLKRLPHIHVESCDRFLFSPLQITFEEKPHPEVWPRDAAMASGVKPFASRALTVAFFESSARTAPTSPFSTA